MAADYLHVLALDLLDACSDGLSFARTGNDPPDRAYVSHGRPPVDVWDGENCSAGQLTVHFDEQTTIRHQTIPSSPQVPRAQEIAPVATLVVQLWRCWPSSTTDGGVPDGADLTARARGLNVDLWSMLTQVYAEHFAGSLFTGVAHQQVTIGAVRALLPSGHVAGWEVRVEVWLNDSGP
jgi:hypothetical protein